MAQLSDDCFARDNALLPVDDALTALDARLHPVVGRETMALDAALGRVLAGDLVAARDVPPHDNSAVDGYAVRFNDLGDGDTRLPIDGRAAAGHPLGRATRPRTAVRIFTGAPMPDGPDTVFMQEDCRLEGDAVVLPPGIARGANRRWRGEDVAAGATVLGAGRRLKPQDLGLAASLGVTDLETFAPLRVAVLSTGDELVDVGTEPAPGQVFDANRHALLGLLAALPCRVTDLGIVADDRATIEDVLLGAARDADLILTSGGMSTGEEDHLAAAVEALGSLHFWRLAIKPGRPVAMGQVGATPFVGLPGNPVAMMVTFLRLARPAILRLAGAAGEAPRLYRVQAGFDHRKKPGRREYLRASLKRGADGDWVAEKFPREGAGILSSMVAADGLVELGEDLTQLRTGATVDFLPFAEVLS